MLPLFKSIQYIQFINLEPHVGNDKLTTHSFVMKVMLQTKVTSLLASHNNPATNAKFQKHGTSKLRFQPGLARSRFCVRGGSKNRTEESKWSKNLELNWTRLQELDSSKNLTQQVYMELDPAQNLDQTGLKGSFIRSRS